MGHFFLQHGRPAGVPRHLRQAGPVLREPHPPRSEHRSLEKADPHHRGLQGPEVACPGRDDRRGVCRGARATLLPGGEVFSALEKGTVDAADYTGPAVNWALGFQQVTNYIWTGPAGLESVYQPVDLMDFVVRMDVWNKLSKKMQQWLDDEIQVYSNIHFSAIQKADMETWPKFIKAGTKINRLPAEDLPKFQRLAVPIWFKWANKDADAARLFKLQLEVMESPTVGYVTPDMYKGLSVKA